MKRKTPLSEKKPNVAVNKSVALVIDYTLMSMQVLKKTMRPKQLAWAHFYIRHWNQSLAAREAGYSVKSACYSGHENAKKPNITEYVQRIQRDIAKEVGISKIQLLEELKAQATSNIFHLFEGDWITKASFATLEADHPELTKAIQEVSTKTSRMMNEDKEPIEIEYVKIKMYDKQKAIDLTFKAMDWYAADKIAITLEQPLFPDVK